MPTEAQYMDAAVRWNKETKQGLSISRIRKLIRRNDPILAKVISYADPTGEKASSNADKQR